MTVSAHPAELATADVRRYLSVLRRRRRVILVTTAAVVVVAVALSFQQESVYRSSVQLLLRPTASEDVVGNPAGTNSQRELSNEIQVIESDVVRKAVEDSTGRRIEKDAVSARVATEGSDVIELSATAADADDAATLANAYARIYVDWRRQQRVEDLLAAGTEIQTRIDGLRARRSQTSAPLDDLDRRLSTENSSEARAALIEQRAALADQLESQLAPIEEQLEFHQRQLDELQLTAKLAESGGLQVLSQAVPPDRAESPRPERDGLVALAVGLLLGLALAFTFEFFDDSIKDRADLERASGGLPVLAAIPKIRRGRREILFPLEEPTSNVAEAYRTLRTALTFVFAEGPIRTLQVTSAAAGEGKTTTVASLAVSLAQAGQRVCAVSCDLRRPRLHEFFGARNEMGLSSALVGQASATELLQPVAADDRISLLSSGPIPPNPSELLGTRRTEEVIQAVAGVVDVAVLDCPPVLPVTDALVVSRLVDATLLVAAANLTSKRQVRRAMDLLRQSGAPIVGTVLTDVTGEDAYGYEEGYAQQRPRRSGGRRQSRRAPTTEPDLRAASSR
ncbi:MAG: polysaccharide biosynthesis tyrosine autokinase [Actinomycetota bacterium]|nr:polysaccharide biosynthesis tyrosine autokinase [Actinomycetota bacterium]